MLQATRCEWAGMFQAMPSCQGLDVGQQVSQQTGSCCKAACLVDMLLVVDNYD
jgi:hypothetical protein